MLSTIVAMPQRQFLEEFVNVHKDEFPEVMEAYRGKLEFDEYTFKQKQSDVELKYLCFHSCDYKKFKEARNQVQKLSVNLNAILG